MVAPALIGRYTLATFPALVGLLDCIEACYAPKEVSLEDNRDRRQSALGYKSPLRFLQD